MSRLLVLMLAFWLPIQFTWAAAAGICQHERTPVAGHAGHHAHEHVDETPAAGAPSSSVADASTLPADGVQALLDDDCGVAHGAVAYAGPVGGGALASPRRRAVGAEPVVPMVRSAPARAPDRPQWMRLA